MTEMLLKDAVVKEFLDEPTEPEQDPGGERHLPQRSTTNLLGDVKPGFLSKIWGKIVRGAARREPNPFYSNTNFNSMKETLDARQMAQQAVSATSARRKAQREYLARHPTYNNSLYIFKPRNKLRRLCQRLVGPARGSERFDGVEPNRVAWYTFSAFIYAAIVAMVVIACITTPLYQKEYQARNSTDTFQWYVWTDLAFAIVFTVESIIKVVADGLVATPNAYLRSSWGIVDAVVLITLWINVGTLLVNDGAISRAIGAFKAFRALRLLNVSNSARDTFHSLIIVGWWKIFGVRFRFPFCCYQASWCAKTAANYSSAGCLHIDLSLDPFCHLRPQPFPQLAGYLQRFRRHHPTRRLLWRVQRCTFQRRLAPPCTAGCN
jgi:hypothetical protein